MKNKLTLAVIFTAFPALFFVIGLITADATFEKLASLVFGLSVPMFFIGVNRLNKKLQPVLLSVKK